MPRLRPIGAHLGRFSHDEIPATHGGHEMKEIDMIH
jgi:hypothetical protein